MLIILGILIVIVGVFVFMYNGFVRKVNQAKEAWAGIDVQLKRRYDLIPNVVSTVKGYAAHESTAFEKVTQARSQAMQATGPAKAGAEEGLSGSLKSLFAIAEAYPELKANQNFLQLQQQLGEIEDNIQSSRRYYNATVRELNTSVETFPGNLLAKMFHFVKMDLFGLDQGDVARNNPEVKF